MNDRRVALKLSLLPSDGKLCAPSLRKAINFSDSDRSIEEFAIRMSCSFRHRLARPTFCELAKEKLGRLCPVRDLAIGGRQCDLDESWLTARSS